MRQKFHQEQEPRRVAYTVPQTQKAVAVPAVAKAVPQVSQSPRTRVQRKAKGRKQLRVQQIVAGVFAFLFLPWLPPVPVTSHESPTNGARAFYANLPIVRPVPVAVKPGEHPLPKSYGYLPDWLKTVEQVRASVATNHAALATLPQGLALPFTDTGAHDHSGRIYRAIRDIQDAKRREGWLNAYDGNHVAAVTAYLDSIELGVQVGKGGNHLAWFLGDHPLEFIFSLLEESAAKLTPEQASAAAQRLTELMHQRTTLTQMMEGERDQNTAELKQFHYGDIHGGGAILSRIPLARAANQYLINHYRTAMDQQIAALKQATPQSRAMLVDDRERLPVDLQILLPLSGQSYSSYTRTSTDLQKALEALQRRAAGK